MLDCKVSDEAQKKQLCPYDAGFGPLALRELGACAGSCHGHDGKLLH